MHVCLRKCAKDKCKQHIQKNKQISADANVVRRGVVATHGLRISGRRGALGNTMGKRNCIWCSGISGASFRVPITAKAHEASCSRNCLAGPGSNKQLWIISQKAG